jgi:nicotinamidase/pyrazinamidase
MKNNCLLIIDPQDDFMPGGDMGVPGADEDMKRLADLIETNKEKISGIFVTLDSHHLVHISHPIWWVDEEGNSPAPFTPIEKNDVVSDNPKWKCKVPYFQDATEDYLTQLEEGSGLTHTIWAPHCLIGSPGHQIESSLYKAILEWEKDFKIVDYVTKGSNMITEHFGAFEAAVPMDAFEDTLFNTELQAALTKFDQIIVGGEASSHCIASTLYQLMDKLSDEDIKKIVYLEDACSPVPGFEGLEDKLKECLRDNGATITTTKDLVL